MEPRKKSSSSQGQIKLRTKSFGRYPCSLGTSRTWSLRPQRAGTPPVQINLEFEDRERTMATSIRTIVKPAHQRDTTLAHLARLVETRTTRTSAVAFDFTPSKIKAPGKRGERQNLFARAGNEHGREEAFRAALDHYIAEYRNHHAAAARDAGQARFPILRALARLFVIS
jgi:hypothetical protein